MALVQTSPLLYPVRGGYSGAVNNNGGSFATLQLASATDVAHQVGRVRWSDNGAHTCTKIHFASGLVAGFSPTSILRVGFQPLLTTAPRGNGSFSNFADLTAGEVNSQTKLVATLNSPLPVANGELACISAQITTFSVGDSLIIRAALFTSAAQMPTVFLNATAQSAVPNLLLEASDGTFGILEGGDFFVSTDDGPNWDSGSTNPERGVSLRVPFKCKVNGIWAGGFRLASSSGAITVRAYSDVLTSPTTLVTLTPGSNEICGAVSSHRFWMVPITEQTLLPGIDYGITIQPTTTINVYVTELNHHTAGYAAALAGGTNYKRIARTSGAFTVDTTKTLQLGFVISALDDGTASGGLMTHPGMGGGMRG